MCTLQVTGTNQCSDQPTGWTTRVRFPAEAAVSRPALEPNQPPAKWGAVTLSSSGRLTEPDSEAEHSFSNYY
jgi:hypothetical protein